ncbi:MAG TPA: protein kinase [Gemmatimonadaceae bacterium]|nr:protein kinase [Gemmatimonadaceae bacterium]
MPADVQDSHHALALRSGALIADRYCLRSVRGASPFAFSYLAEDQLTGETVVVKEFFPRNLVSRSADGTAARPHSPDCERDFLRALHRFALEGAVLAEVAHPNLVRVRAVVDANQTVYLIMDRHESRSLADHVRGAEGRVAPADAARIIQQLLSALELLHAESIIHRDLSPRTVHVADDGGALLLEFSARRHLPVHTTDLAAGFAAFEQYGAKDIGPWTDVYASAALLYYLLTGTTPPSALERASGEAVVSPLMGVPGLAPGLAGLVMRGMALLPQQRPHAVSELRRQLEAALSEARAPIARTAYTAPASEVASRHDGVAGDAAELDGGGALRLAAGGIVLPGEERSSAKLFKMLRSAASMFGGGSGVDRDVVPTEQPNELAQLEALARAATNAPPLRPTALEERAAPMVSAPTFAPIVPAPEPSIMAAPEPAQRFDLVSDLGLQSDEMGATYAEPSRRRRYSLAAAAILVVAVGSSLILLARNGRASGFKMSSTGAKPATQSAGAVAAPATLPNGTHEVVESGVVQSSGSLAGDRQAADSPDATKRATPASAATRNAEPAPVQRALPSGKLVNVKIALAAAPDLKIVPPEVVVDERTRLTNGQDQADQGDYAVARRTFRSAIASLDSVAVRYPDSQAIRDLRRELEQADSRALQACTAENEMRKRRGEEARACQ